MTIIEFLKARIAEDMSQVMRHEKADRYDTRVLASGEYWHVEVEHIRWQLECEAKLRIIELHERWPVLIEGPMQFAGEREGGLDGLTYRIRQNIAWLTEEQYRKTFGSEPPTAPMIKALAAIYQHHNDFEEQWL